MRAMENAKSKPRVSVIVPLFNEEEYIGLLVDKIFHEMRALACSFEVVLVDDGSSDDTLVLARALVVQNPELRVVSFRRNYGQTPAMAAGIDYARGQILVTMDGDLQNDPADIGAFLNKIDEGYDLVVGWRHNRQDKLFSRKIPSIVANKLIAHTTGVPIKDNGCSLKAYRADVIKRVPLYAEMHRFIPAMSSMVGIKLHEMKVRHHPRQFGESKYGLSRIYKVALDLLAIKTILSTVSKPMHYFGKFAIVFALAGVVATLLGVAQNSMIAFSISTLFFVSALIWLFWGILCELLVHTGDKLDMTKLSPTRAGQ